MLLRSGKATFLAIVFVCSTVGVASAHDDEEHAEAEGVHVLYLTKSAGFQHSVVQERGDEPSHSARILRAIVENMGGWLDHTKDAGLINNENLTNYDVVVFFTTGDLRTPGFDRKPPMEDDSVEALLDWIRNGGGFVGFHSASDTFHRNDQEPESPYLEMLGGEFAGHGRQFPGFVEVVSKGHPTMARIDSPWRIRDEWYLFKHYSNDTMHVLALLNPGIERRRQDMYNIPSYPIAWCSVLGEGRVFYNAMGHREDVWTNTTFQDSVEDAIRWASGKGEAMAEPNFDEVVPTQVEASETR